MKITLHENTIKKVINMPPAPCPVLLFNFWIFSWNPKWSLILLINDMNQSKICTEFIGDIPSPSPQPLELFRPPPLRAGRGLKLFTNTQTSIHWTGWQDQESPKMARHKMKITQYILFNEYTIPSVTPPQFIIVPKEKL